MYALLPVSHTQRLWGQACWRDALCVQCESCWAHVPIMQMELATCGSLSYNRLSPQYVLDYVKGFVMQPNGRSYEYFSSECQGGWMSETYR